jgi:hypothetical protein
MNNTKKRFFSLHTSKKYLGKYRIVEWFGKHPNIWVETIQDNLTYGQAVIKKEEL